MICSVLWVNIYLILKTVSTCECLPCIQLMVYFLQAVLEERCRHLPSMLSKSPRIAAGPAVLCGDLDGMWFQCEESTCWWFLHMQPARGFFPKKSLSVGRAQIKISDNWAIILTAVASNLVWGTWPSSALIYFLLLQDVNSDFPLEIV